MATPDPLVPLPDPALWPAVRRVLDALDDVPAGDREAAIEAACRDADDPEALAREVRASLAAEAAAGASDFLGDAAAHDAAHLLSDARTDVIGQRVGPWRIAGLLGEGGMGTVYRADRADGAYDQQAALKVIGRGLAPPSLVERFRRERQILAGLQHPHVARLLDGGVSDAGQPYFAMELVDGLPITTYANEHRLAVDARVRLLRQTADAVAYAHRRLVVHRDLKPTNVLVTEDDDGAPCAVLLDFGIAKLLDDDASLTRTAAPMTPEYGAPEQVVGGEITTATDVYALGVLLYELLAGRRPFDLAGLTPTAVERTLATHPPPPSAQAPGVSRDLDAIALKALAPEPERRYASAASMGDDLDRYLGGLPVTARAPTVRYRAASFVRRHPAGVAAASAFLLLLIGFSIFTAAQARRLATERDRAHAEVEKAGEMQDYLVGLFTAVDPDESQGQELTARDLLAAGAAGIETDLADRPELQAELYERIGNVYSALGYHDEAVAARERLLVLSRRVYGDRSPEVVRAYTLLGASHFDRGAPQAADSVLALADALVPGTFDEPTPTEASLYRVQAMLRNSLGDTEQADALFRRSIAVLDGAAAPDSTLLSQSLAGLGLSLYNQGDYAGADSLFQRRLVLSRALHGDLHTDVAFAYHYLGLVARSDGRLGDAERHNRRALAIRRQLLGDDHPDTAQTLSNLAVVYKTLGRYAEAEVLYRETLATMAARLGPSHIQVAITRNNIASLLIEDGRAAEALPVAERALRDVSAHFGPGHASTALIRGTRAKAHLAAGHLAAAQADFETGLRLHRAAVDGPHPRQSVFLTGLGRTYLAQGRAREAEAMCREALTLLLDEHGPDDLRVAEARVDLALVLAERGETAEARRLLAQAAPVVRPAYADAGVPPRRRLRQLERRLS